MRKSILRKILGGLSLTTALFIFQACYGTDGDMKPDMLLEGRVTSKISSLPVEGIKVSVPAFNQFQFTDETGKFSFYTLVRENISVLFEDVDSSQNGLFVSRDTVLSNVSESVYLDIQLEEK